jgi:D-alanyl-lipoteichoic acid acyltransferase DltB (MBOAT superfamily)
VYIPLGGSRVGPSRYALNILITFGISGLWHGASWTYLWWGLLNGIYLIVGWLTKGWRDRFFESIGLGERTAIRQGTMWASTFVLTCVAWIVFRSKSLADALYIVSHLLRGWNLHRVSTAQFLLRELPIAVAAIVVLEACQLSFRNGNSVSSVVGRLSLPGRWVAYAGLVLLVVMFGVYRKTQFIYFQF